MMVNQTQTTANQTTSDPRRVVVADDNVEIVIALYAHGQAVSTTIKPVRALELARRLIEAALPKLENGEEEGK